MDDFQKGMYEALCSLSTERVVNLFLDWLGDQVLDEDFRVFLGEEGIMDEVAEEEDKSEDIFEGAGVPFLGFPCGSCERRFYCFDQEHCGLLNLYDVANVILEDDETETGGTDYQGETVEYFLACVDPFLQEIRSIKALNEALKECGIKPIKPEK